MSNTTSYKNNKLKRETSLDLLRGIAVLLMVLAHTIPFLHTSPRGLLLILQILGDTLCFTIFLLVSGASSYFAYLRNTDQEWIPKRVRLLKRLLKLLIGYYFVAIISSLQDFPIPPNHIWIKNVIQILVFIKVPGYTEFLLPFIFYGFLVLLFRHRLRTLVEKKRLIIILVPLTYLLGYVIHKVPLPSPLVYYKSLIAGEADWFRFPLLQYSGVFLIGILLGQLLERETFNRTRQLLLIKFTFISVIVLLSAFVLELYAHFPYIQEFRRWPPSITFIALGLSFSFIMLLLIHTKIEVTIFKLLRESIAFLGKFAFGIYTSHIVILQLEELLFGYKFSQTWQVLASYILLMLICAFLIPIIRLFSYNSIKRLKNPQTWESK